MEGRAMNPAVAAVIGLQVARAIARRRGQPVPSGGGPEGPIGTWSVVVWLVVMPVGVLLVVGGLWPLLPVLALIAFPWPIARLVLIPLGMPRLAYWLTYTSDVTFRKDRSGGAAVAGAWALAMTRSPGEGTADWLANKLAEEAPLRGAGVLASALLLAARGDLDGARALLAAVGGVDDRACPPAAKRIARAFLAADAAERGAWAEVAELGQTLRGGGRLPWLLSAVAQSLLLEPMAPGKLGLWLRWAIAPRRRATLPWVRRAIAALDGAFVDVEEEPPIAPARAVAPGDGLSTALSLHASVLARPGRALRPEDVRAAGQAWEAVLFDRTTERRLLERALVLGASGAPAALERMRAAVEEDLAAVVLASGMPLVELMGKGSVVTRVRTRLRDRLLEEVEALSDALRRRVDEKRGLPAPDEWREWSRLRETFERGAARGGEDFRRLAFAKVYPDACSYGVWLYNEQHQRPLGNAVFRFLLAEATRLDDTRAIGLMSKNVECGV
jgi:hypothetical protein